MAIQFKLWWVFAAQTVLLAGTLAGIITAFSLTGNTAVDRAVKESVHNNLLHLESTILGYLGPMPRVADRLLSFRAAYGLSCAQMGEENTSHIDRQTLFTEMALGAKMFSYIDYLYFVEVMSSGKTADCSAIVDREDKAISIQYMTPQQQAHWYSCPSFPCRTDNSSYFMGNETLDIEDEDYVKAIRSVGRDAMSKGVWLQPTAYSEPALGTVVLSTTFTIPFSFGEDGLASGSVAVDVSLQWFKDTLLSVRNTPTTHITVVDAPSGFVLCTTMSGVPPFDEENSVAWPITRLPNAEAREVVLFAASRMGVVLGGVLLREVEADKGEEPMSYIAEKGSSLVSARLIVDGTLEWLAVASTPTAYYYGTSRRVMTIVTVVACVVALVMCAVSVGVWVGVVFPLKRMTHYMQKVSQLEFGSATSTATGSVSPYSRSSNVADEADRFYPTDNEQGNNQTRAITKQKKQKKKNGGGDSSRPVLGELDGMHGAFKDMSRAIQSFTQYVPLEVVRGLMRSGEQCDVRMVPAFCTIMFADIAGFTPMCERIDTTTLVRVTRLYFDRMSLVVVAYGGTIDKFIGDCIMAIWGAPVETKDSNVLASCCAVRLVQETRQEPLESEFASLGFPLKIRVGVHCGDVLAGNIGCSLRLSYTVLGDAVNTAARLESLNKQFGTNIMVSEEVAASLGDYFVLRRLSRVAVAGKSVALRVFEIVGVDSVTMTRLGNFSLPPPNDGSTPWPSNRKTTATGAVPDVEYSDGEGAKEEVGGVPDEVYVRLDVPSQGLVPVSEIFADISDPKFFPSAETVRFALMYSEAVKLWEKSRIEECKGSLREIRVCFTDDFLRGFEASLAQLWEQCDIAAETRGPLSRPTSIGESPGSRECVFIAVSK